MGGDARAEIPQWGISAKNARPVAGPGWQALPGGATRLDSGQKGKVRKGLKATHCAGTRLGLPVSRSGA